MGKRRPIPRGKIAKTRQPGRFGAEAMTEEELDWAMYEMYNSAIAQSKIRESVANMECGGTSRMVRHLDLADVPPHLMQDDFDNMELTTDESGEGVAQLEVKDHHKAFKTFYNLDDLEDVDE